MASVCFSISQSITDYQITVEITFAILDIKERLGSLGDTTFGHFNNNLMVDQTVLTRKWTIIKANIS